MKYEEMLKEELISKCYKKDELIKELKELIEKIKENEEINKDILLENTRLKQELKEVIYQRDMNCHTINNLVEQLEIYKNCVKALSGNVD